MISTQSIQSLTTMEQTSAKNTAANGRLSPEQIMHFESNGYLAPIDILAAGEVKACRTRLEQYESELGHPVQGPLRTKPHLLFKWVDNLMRDPRILDCVEDLIGADIQCWNSWFWIKETNTTSYVSWHQDSQYWGLDTSRLVTAWLALSPATEAAGCMQVIPGSHQGPGLQHADLYQADNLLTRGQEIVDLDTSVAASMPLQAGQMSFHNVGIAHGSGPNRTNDRRIGLSFHYMPVGTKQLNAEWDSAALVRGSDPFGYFEQSPVPDRDLDPVTVAFHKKATDAMRDMLFKGADKVRPTI